MKLEPLLTLHVDVEPILSAGETPNGEVRLVRFAGGRFEGPSLRGVVLPGGTDWQRVRADGALEIRAHYLLETEQGERIEVVSEGIRHADPGVVERLSRGEPVPAEAVYFRTHIRLVTAAARLAHLNRMIFVSSGERGKTTVRLTFYAVP